MNPRKMVLFVQPLLCLHPATPATLMSTFTTNAEAYINPVIGTNATNGDGDITTLCKQGRIKEALHIMLGIDERGISPDSSIYAPLLQCCVNLKALAEGKLVHAHIIETGFIPDVYLETKLVILYAKCRSLLDGRRVLDGMPKRNVVSWTAMIAAYAKHGFEEEAWSLYCQMQLTGCQPDHFTFASILPSCAAMTSLQQGKKVHEDINRSGFESNVFVGSALIDMYVKCGSLEDARKVFDEMPVRNVVSWTSMISGYVQKGFVDEALVLFDTMPERDLVSWNVMIAGYAQCGQAGTALDLFQKMPVKDAISWNAMLAAYAQNGQLEEAFGFFQKMPERNVVSWNTLIAAYARHNQGEQSFKLLKRMKETSIQPDQYTVVSILQACSNLTDLEYGKEIHEEIIRNGFECTILIGCSLMDMYAKCGCVEDASKVFGKMPEGNMQVSNVMIAGYIRNAYVDEALKLFQEMHNPNVESCNAMIAGYVHNGFFDEALKIYQQMKLTGVKPDTVSIISVLPACSNLSALQHGKMVHKDIIKTGFVSNIFVGSALVDMYGKCGNIKDAREVFDELSSRDIVSWSALIVGYAINGYGKEAIQLFERMRELNVRPNHVTFVGVLAACCYSGLVEDGWSYFKCMSKDYDITPLVEHYCCMVDLLCRVGRLDEALDFIHTMPIKPDAAVWGSLLAGCRNHNNLKLGEYVADYLFETDAKNPANYVLLSNIYAAAGRWDNTGNVRQLMKSKKVKKMPGCSWIEIKNKVYSFVVGDKSHPHMQQIYEKLESLSGQMKEAGYVPNRNAVLRDVEDEQKEHILCHHSEKLAIAFGLLNIPPGIPIRIVKNLRVCDDCHSAIKFISKIVAREFIVRDANRFHHFREGQCSCGDYW